MAIILVTGSNQGIGRAVVQRLKGEHTVILSGRNKVVVEKASQEESCDFVVMEVTDQQSIDAAYAYIKEKYGMLDVLINNAGILIDFTETVSIANLDHVRKTLEVNTLGALAVSQKFLGLLKKSEAPKIVNVSSGLGAVSEMTGAYCPGYRMSKAALNAITRMLAAEHPEIEVNSVCPGWVHTRMGGSDAPRTPEQGSETIAWLATGKRGSAKFFRDKEEVAW